MLTEKKKLGDLGERLAAEYLVLADYRILERNWRSGHHEVDIIAEWFGEIVFVEVKTRSKGDYRTALEAVDRSKRKFLISSARHYLSKNKLDNPYRFDVITVVGEEEPFSVTHFKSAFLAE